MRLFSFLCLFLVLIGVLFACPCENKGEVTEVSYEAKDSQHYIVEVGESIGPSGTVEEAKPEQAEEPEAQTEETVIVPYEDQPVSEAAIGSEEKPLTLIAQTHTCRIGDVTVVFNDTLVVDVRDNGDLKPVALTPAPNNSVEIKEGGASVLTDKRVKVMGHYAYVDDVQLSILPSSVGDVIGAENIESLELESGDDGLFYKVKATKAVKLLWLFDAEMEVEVTLDATTGEITEQKGPWWGFLASN